AVRAHASAGEPTLRGVRLVAGYVVLAALVVAAATVSIHLGHSEKPAPGIAGFYTAPAGSCLGRTFELRQAGEFLDVDGAGGAGGKLRLRHRRIAGGVTCADGTHARLALAVRGKGTTTVLVGAAGGAALSARFAKALPAPGASAKPAPERSGEETFGR